jgi:hypothetical protein
MDLMKSRRWVVIQYTESKDDHDSDFGLRRHMNRPDHRNWQKRVEPVRQNRHDTNGIGCLHDLLRGDTGALLYPPIPLLLKRAALEHIPEEQHGTPDGDDGQANGDDPEVDALDRESQEEEANAQFYKHHIEDVRRSREGLPLESADQLVEAFGARGWARLTLSAATFDSSSVMASLWRPSPASTPSRIKTQETVKTIYATDQMSPVPARDAQTHE